MPGNDRVNSLDTRVSVLETKDEFVVKALEKNEQQHETIQTTLDGMSDDLKTVVRAMPSLTRAVETLDSRVDQAEKDYVAVQTDVNTMKSRWKYVVAAISSLIIGVVTFFVTKLGGG